MKEKRTTWGEEKKKEYEKEKKYNEREKWKGKRKIAKEKNKAIIMKEIREDVKKYEKKTEIINVGENEERL